ncbi:MAG: glutathione peroxidase [Bacteroidetes bacterium]|nr:glutathione peroxidase [Bacteroidota bacterium]
MKPMLSLLLMVFLMNVLNSGCKCQNMKKITSFYEFVVQDIHNNKFEFDQLKGKKVMIVNTASKCGYTPQYEALQELYELYQDQNFTIIAFPSNNFLFQEPGDNAEIEKFCKEKYKITFPLMAKISVKGNKMHPVYQYLTSKIQNGILDSKVKWNFQKYLINENGELAKMLKPSTNPLDSVIINWIEN